MIAKPFVMHAALAGLLLTGIAIVTPTPAFFTDRDVYEQMSREWVIRDCDDLQCFRPIVSWTLGLLPGSGYGKWRAYAVVCETLAALAMSQWVLRMGGSATAAVKVLWLTALGTGALYTVFDPYTSDPLMHLLGPAAMTLLFDGRILAAALFSIFGILAKEFAVVPLAISAITFAWQRRFAAAHDALLGAGLVVGVWSLWGVISRAAFNYTIVESQSSKTLLSGGYLRFWLEHLNPGLAVVALAAVFAGCWVLWPAGLRLAGAPLRTVTVVGAVPLAVLTYVQQPDRALWNFAFLAMPAVALMLDRIPPSLGWSLVAIQALVGFRVGAQFPYAPPARLSLAGAFGLAMFAVWKARLR